jgi:hypothetical protein
VQNVYEGEEIAVKVDLTSLGDVTGDVHKESSQRMRQKFSASIGEEQKKELTKEEMDFVPHYMLLVASADLEKV